MLFCSSEETPAPCTGSGSDQFALALKSLQLARDVKSTKPVASRNAHRKTRDFILAPRPAFSNRETPPPPEAAYSASPRQYRSHSGRKPSFARAASAFRALRLPVPVSNDPV